jgi:type I restriction-modification system DNA methylase subunit
MDLEKLKQDVKLLVDKCDRYVANKEELSEDDVKSRLIGKLFKALGWDMEDDLGLNQVREQKNQPQGRPDYIFYLNGSISLFLEAKKFKDMTEDDIKQALNYARSRNKRWAVLSNFKETIILICDKKGTSLLDHIYKRIPYDKLITNISDLLLLSRESFESGLIETEAQKDGKTKQTTKIDEELLDDILTWRKHLIQSIKENNKTDYQKETLEEIVQTLLNRIIFIRTVEDRKEEAYPDKTIKEILNQYDNDKRINIKDKLNILFIEYDKVYDSKLFTYDENDSKKRHICEAVDIDNKTYYKILKETYDKNDIYSYKFNEIDADILGQMYEKYISKIQKAEGIYYTPTYIVDYIVNNTIKPLIKNKKLEDVDKIKVLDMTCGSGSFLLKAFDVFDEYYKSKDKLYLQKKIDVENESSTKSTKTKILKNNIYGVDLDKKAVEIAQLNLLLRIAETRYRLPDLRNNIQQGDSLIDDDKIDSVNAFVWTQRFQFNKEGNGFDIVIGNPPWVSFGLRDVGKLDKKISTFYRERYSQSAEYKLSTYALFIQRGIDQLKDGGYMSFILPDSFLLGRYFSKIRRYILDTCEIKKILMTFYDVFSDKATTGRNVIIILKKESNAEKRIKNLVDVIKADSQENFEKGIFESYSYKQDYFEKSVYNRFRLFFNQREKELIEKMDNDSKNVIGDFLEPYSGCIGRFGQDSIISDEPKNDIEIRDKNDKVVYKDTKIKNNWKLLIPSSSNVRRYYLNLNNTKYIYVEPDKEKRRIYAKSGFDLERYSSKKLFMPQTGDSLVASLSESEVYCINNVHILTLKESPSVDIKYLLALLNSKLINYYYHSVSLEYGRTMAQTDIETIEKLPITIPNVDIQEKLIKLVDKMLSLNKQFNEIKENTDEKSKIKSEKDKTDAEIDEMVYKIYGIIDETDKKIIEDSLL